MCHLVYDLSALVEGLQSPRGLAGLLSDMAPSMCRFWFSGGLVGEERAGCLAF